MTPGSITELSIVDQTETEREARGAAARALSREFAWPDVAGRLRDLYERLTMKTALRT